MNSPIPLADWLLLGLALLAVGIFAGYRLGAARVRKGIDASFEAAADQIESWKRNRTMAGAYELAKVPLDGVEKCYYTPPDFQQVAWSGTDSPAPFVGFAPQPGVSGSAIINNLGFRYAQPIAARKGPNVCRVFVVGGSTAFGAGASSDDATIGGYLEKYLNEAVAAQGGSCEVITAAACAWASTHERILIENRLIELSPDIVLSVSGHNDAHWARMGRNVLWLQAYQDDYFFQLADTTLRHCSGESFVRESVPGNEAVEAAKSADRLTHNVALGIAALAPTGADYIFALQPVLLISRKVRTPREQRMADRREESVGLEACYQEFRRRLSALEQPGFRFLDLTDVFDSYDNSTDIFLDGCHFGDRGNDIVAQRLLVEILPMVMRRLSQVEKGTPERARGPAS